MTLISVHNLAWSPITVLNDPIRMQSQKWLLFRAGVYELNALIDKDDFEAS
jgi:hypothetical protein